MPLWEFYCPKCKTTIERLFPNFTKAKNAKCDCGTKLQRQVSSGSFVVNGFNAKNNYSKR